MSGAHRSVVAIGLASISALAAQAAPSTPATSASAAERESHTARCVAALDLSTRHLAEQVKAGKDEMRPLLLARLKSGAAFVGSAYLAGARDEGRSHALLDSALAAQKALPESELAARQAACDDEGTRLLSRTNAIEREVVSRVAAKRMTLLLSE
jgi:hypothetical protein